VYRGILRSIEIASVLECDSESGALWSSGALGFASGYTSPSARCGSSFSGASRRSLWEERVAASELILSKDMIVVNTFLRLSPIFFNDLGDNKTP